MYVPVMEHGVSINADLNMAESGTNFNVKIAGCVMPVLAADTGCAVR